MSLTENCEERGRISQKRNCRAIKDAHQSTTLSNHFEALCKIDFRVRIYHPRPSFTGAFHSDLKGGTSCHARVIPKSYPQFKPSVKCRQISLSMALVGFPLEIFRGFLPRRVHTKRTVAFIPGRNSCEEMECLVFALQFRIDWVMQSSRCGIYISSYLQTMRESIRPKLPRLRSRHKFFLGFPFHRTH
jgi:hypothetical protein